MSQHSRFSRAEPAAGARSAVFMLPAVSANAAAIRAGVQQVAPDLLSEMHAVTGLDVVEICRRNTEILSNARVAQPVVYMLGYAYGRLLEERGVPASMVAGHGLGQYAALALAGSLDFSAGLRLVQARAEAIERVPPPQGTQLVKVLGLDAAKTESICSDAALQAWPATIIAADEVIVRGFEQDLVKLVPRFRDAGAERVILLMGSGALHTPLMSTAVESMQAALADAPLDQPAIAFVSSTSGRREQDPNRLREVLAHELDSPLRWHECLAAMPEGIPLVEVGASGGLVGSILARRPDRVALTVDSLEAAGRLAPAAAPVPA